MIFGYSELKQFHSFEEGKMISYGYRVDYDRYGCEVKRTRPEPLSSVGWDNSSPFTEEEYNQLKRGGFVSDYQQKPFLQNQQITRQRKLPSILQDILGGVLVTGLLFGALVCLGSL